MFGEARRRERMIVIDLSVPTITCCVCGDVDLNRWGIPIDSETALICGNDFTGEWGVKPACRRCYEVHDNGGLVGHDPAF